MSPVSTIAHYRLTSKLGEGVMGAVYRATDTKLNRDVAIKILPEAFASDPDRLARFTREAQVHLNPERRLDAHQAESLQQELMGIGRGRDISVACVMGDTEGTALASQILQAFKGVGWNILNGGLSYEMWTTLPRGVLVKVHAEGDSNSPLNKPVIVALHRAALKWLAGLTKP